MQVKHPSNENPPIGQYRLFTGFAIFYLLCIAALLLPSFMEGIYATWPGWMAQIFESRMKLLGFIAAACAFLTIIVKYITDEPTQWTPELPLGFIGSLAGFCVALLLLREGNSAAQATLTTTLIVLATPVFYSLYLWTRRIFPYMGHSASARIYTQTLIRTFQFAGLMIVWGFITAAVQWLLAAFGIAGVLIISTIILILLIAVALLIRRAFISRD